MARAEKKSRRFEAGLSERDAALRETNKNVTLTEALRQNDIALPADQTSQLDEYCRLLWDWNQRLNLTRHLDYDTFVARDVVDSLQLAECLNEHESVLDLGSGGGVPGIPLAILRPDVSITLCDSIEKKAKALAEIVSELKIPVEVINARIQDLLPEHRCDTLVARAVGPTTKILRWLDPHWDSFRRLLLIKGPRWIEERHQARQNGLMKNIDLRVLKKYPMPGTRSESVVLSFRRKAMRKGTR